MRYEAQQEESYIYIFLYYRNNMVYLRVNSGKGNVLQRYRRRRSGSRSAGLLYPAASCRRSPVAQRTRQYKHSATDHHFYTRNSSQHLLLML